MKPAQFIRHAAIYGVSSMLVQAAGLILLPLYTRYLSKEDFGLLEILTRIGETISTVLVIGGLRLATLSLYQQAEEEKERRQVVTASIASLVVSCLVGGLLALLLIDFLIPWLQTPQATASPLLFRLAILCITIEPFIMIPLALMQARTESAGYALVNFGLFLLRVSLCVLLVAGLGWGIQGVLLGTALSVGSFGLVLTCREIRLGIHCPTGLQIKALWRFAVPFLPGGLCFFLLHHGDRFWLSAWYGMAEVGTYALGYKLALAVNTFALAPLQLVWSPQVYRIAREDDAPRTFGVAFTRILTVYAFLGLGLCLFRREIVAALSPAEYAPAATVIVPILLACFCQAAATLMDSAFYIRRRTGLKLGVTLAATLVMLGLYAVFIPLGGALGAALATLGGFAFLTTATWCVTRWLFPVEYETGRLVGCLSLALLEGFLLDWMPVGTWSSLLKGLAWALYPLILWQAGLISPVEKGYAADLVQTIRKGVRRWVSPRPLNAAEGA